MPHLRPILMAHRQGGPTIPAVAAGSGHAVARRAFRINVDLVLVAREHTIPEGIDAMERNHLRVYYGPEEEVCATLAHQQQTVSVPLSEIFPLLADAVRSQRTWLRDFEEDEITISTDLYEVLLAYQHYRRPSA